MITVGWHGAAGRRRKRRSRLRVKTKELNVSKPRGTALSGSQRSVQPLRGAYSRDSASDETLEVSFLPARLQMV